MSKSKDQQPPPRVMAVEKMISEPKDGGRATYEMTLRDYFAAQALSGFCAHLALDSAEGPIWNPDGVALRVFELADAMVKVRQLRRRQDLRAV